MKLVERELPLIDNTSDPKLPFFLYDPDLANGSMTQGLFRGPLLLAASASPHCRVESHRPGSSRFTGTSSYHRPPRLAQSHHQSVEMQRFTA